MTDVKKSLDAYATFTGETAEQVAKDKDELKMTWSELILKGIETAKKERK